MAAIAWRTIYAACEALLNFLLPYLHFLSQKTMPSSISSLHIARSVFENQPQGPLSQSESPYFVKPERLTVKPLASQQYYHATWVIPSVKRRRHNHASVGSPGPGSYQPSTPFAASQNHTVSAVKSFKFDSVDAVSELHRFRLHIIDESFQWELASCPNGSKASTNPAEYMLEPEGAAAFGVRAALVHPSIRPASTGSNEECKLKKKNCCLRFGAAICRFSHRCSARAQLFRDYWSERRELRESRRRVRRDIKVKKRSIALLEKEKCLADLKARVLEVSHKRNQEHKDHQQAAYHRQLAAQLANKRRQLELLEHQAALIEAAAPKQAFSSKSTPKTRAKAKAAKTKALSKKSSPSLSASSPSCSKESLLRPLSSRASPSRSSVSGAAVALNSQPKEEIVPAPVNQLEESSWDEPWLLKVPLVMQSHAKDRFSVSGPAFRDRFSRCPGCTHRPLQRVLPS